MHSQNLIRAAYYLRISTEAQELDNQRAEIMPFIERRGWKLVHPFEDVMSGGKTEKDRPGFAAMLKAAHQRRFDIVVFWALDRLTREGTRATLNYLQRLCPPARREANRVFSYTVFHPDQARGDCLRTVRKFQVWLSQDALKSH